MIRISDSTELQGASLPSHFVPVHLWGEAPSVFLTLFPELVTGNSKVHPSLLFWKLNKPSSGSLFLCILGIGVLLILPALHWAQPQHVHVFVLLNSLKLGALLQLQSHKGKWRQTFWPTETVLIFVHMVQLAFAKEHCQFSFTILSIRMPQSFSAKLFQMLEPQLLFLPGAILSQIQDSVFALVLMRFLPSSVISSACPCPSELQPVLLHVVLYYLQRGWVSSLINKDWTVSALLKSRCTTPFVPPMSTELVSSSRESVGLVGHNLPLLNSLHLLAFHVISNGFQEDLLHNVPEGWDEAIWLESPCLPPLKTGVVVTIFSCLQELPLAVTFKRWHLFLEWCQTAPSAPFDAADLLPCVACAQFAEAVPDPAFLYSRFHVIPIDSAGSLWELQCLVKNEEKKRDGQPLPFSCLLSLTPFLHWATCPHSH